VQQEKPISHAQSTGGNYFRLPYEETNYAPGLYTGSAFMEQSYGKDYQRNRRIIAKRSDFFSERSLIILWSAGMIGPAFSHQPTSG